jgi:hypothetical protein
LRSRKYLGESATVQDTLPEGRMKLYALLDYRIHGVSVSLNAARATPGSEVQIQCAIQTDSKPADLHALDLRLLAPDGQSLSAYRTIVLAPEGKARVCWRLALNQPLGKHKLRVTDVVSGATGEAELEVEELSGVGE